MSGYGYDELVEEEYRRRQALQAGSALGAPQASGFSALAGSRARPGGEYGYLSNLGVDAAAGASPYGAARGAAAGTSTHPAHAAAAAPYGRLGDPYAGLVGADPARAAYGAPSAPGSSLTDLYASRQHQSQAALQQAVAANYANYGAAAGAAPPAGYASVYGIAPASGAAAYDPAQPPPPGVPPPYDPKTAQDIARMQEAYQRERENAIKRRHGTSYLTSPIRSPSAASSKTPAGKGKKTPLSTPKSATTASSDASSSPKKKEMAILSKDKDGKLIVEDRGDIWYMGAVPLGVDDDKYWLSELQVYLRSNFAEAFAAAEEDIAAPMHGRNKPIALGQVGIRCCHCKRK